MEKITKEKVKSALQANKFVIFDFSSPGCAPCKKIKPLLQEIIFELTKSDIKVYEIDITEEPTIAQDLMVMGVPTVIVFKEDKEIQRFNSIPKKKKLLQLLS